MICRPLFFRNDFISRCSKWLQHQQLGLPDRACRPVRSSHLHNAKLYALCSPRCQLTALCIFSFANDTAASNFGDCRASAASCSVRRGCSSRLCPMATPTVSRSAVRSLSAAQSTSIFNSASATCASRVIRAPFSNLEFDIISLLTLFEREVKPYSKYRSFTIVSECKGVAGRSPTMTRVICH